MPPMPHTKIYFSSRAQAIHKVYLKFPGADYWVKLDKCLAKNRREADMKKITRVFCKFLDEDQEKHGKTVLCARIALMRQVYLKHPDGDFWDQLDDHLDEIRNKAKNQETHSQQVDDIIAVDTATSTASVQDSTA
ncbi:hypothetical protein B0H14DRAFT_3489919 [Mycena olivaceomarginata]|nr:hypothetical protein B0H14DRAFT_3489919 [Mycena olivaceomarginata]